MDQEPLSDEPVTSAAVAPSQPYVRRVLQPPRSPPSLPGQTNTVSVSSPARPEDDAQQREAMVRALALMNAEKAVAVARQFMAQRQYHQLKAAGVPDEQVPLDVVANAFGAQAAPLLNARRLAAQKPFVPQFVPPDVASGAPGYIRSGVQGSTVNVLQSAPETGPISGVPVIDPATGQPVPGMFGVRGSAGRTQVIKNSEPAVGKLSDVEKFLIREDDKRRAELERLMEHGLSIALKDPKSPQYPKAVETQKELEAIRKRMAELRTKLQLPAQSAGVKVRRKSDGEEFWHPGNPAKIPLDKYEVISGGDDERE